MNSVVDPDRQPDGASDRQPEPAPRDFVSPSRGVERSLLDTGRLHIVEFEETYENGHRAGRVVVRHPGAAVILPLIGSDVIAVQQYRSALDQWIYELPAGTIDPGEAPIETARRELEEETGWRAGSMDSLGILYPAPGFCDEIQHLFVARGLVEGRVQRDASERMSVVRLSLERVAESIVDGSWCDAKSIAAVTRYLWSLRKPEFGL